MLGILLLFVLVACCSQFDLYLLSFSSTGSTVSSSKLPTYLGYYCPLCSSVRLACVTVDVCWQTYAEFLHSACPSLAGYFIAAVSVYSVVFTFSVLLCALPMFTKQLAAYYCS
jgi:hypothetical protein